MALSYIVFVALVAEIAGTVAGFGSSSILLPLIHGRFPYEQAIAFVAVYHIFGNTTRLSMFWRHVNRKIVLLFGIPSIVCTVVGAYLIAGINPHMLKVILGIVLILFAIYSLYNHRFVFPKNRLFAIVGGGLSGFTAGIIGTGGVLRGAFLQGWKLPKETYLGTIAMIALIVDVTRIPLYAVQGFFTSIQLLYFPLLLLVALFGSRIGRQIIARMKTTIFRTIIYVGIILLSIKLIWDGVVVLGYL